MRAREALRLVGGSIVVYVVMAACGSDSQKGGFADVDAGSGTDPHDGSTAGPGTDGASLLDALTNPVPDANADPTTSGTRLKARYYVGEDGSKQFVGWHDSQRNEDCGFSKAGDGVLRCLPSAGASEAGIFSDSGCTQPLAIAANCTTGAKYATVATLSCGALASVRVFSLGSPVTPTVAYAGTPAACTMYPAASLTSLEMTNAIYPVGAEVAPSSFVSATEQVDP